MTLFRRVLRGLFICAGLFTALLAGLTAVFARLLIRPPRLPLWVTPGELGMTYDNVQFPAVDGARLDGWFIPAAADSSRQGATVILVHGWLWNRLGTPADDVVSRLTGNTPVELLRLAHALHRDGFHVLMSDWRNHGQSADVSPVQFGIDESQDLLGALAFVKTQADVDPKRIAVIGFSTGANMLLYALPQTDEIQAAIAVQPTSADVFARRYGRDTFGPLGGLIVPLAEMVYRRFGGRPFAHIRPSSAARHAGDVPVLFVQGNGDPWGSAADVAQMAAATPNAVGPLYVDATHRFEGYQYLIHNPRIAIAFLEQYLA